MRNIVNSVLASALSEYTAHILLKYAHVTKPPYHAIYPIRILIVLFGTPFFIISIIIYAISNI